MVCGNKASAMRAIFRHRLPVCSTPICSHACHHRDRDKRVICIFAVQHGRAPGSWCFILYILFLKFIIVSFPSIKITIAKHLILHEKEPRLMNRWRRNFAYFSCARLLQFLFIYCKEQSDARVMHRLQSGSLVVDKFSRCDVFMHVIRL